MERRQFVGQAMLTTFGMLSGELLFACSKHVQNLEVSDFKGKILIIGAGASGLSAGQLLKSKGVDFEILEASDKIGGRLGKLDGFADFPIDLGAQWLHGKKSIAGELVKKTGTKITRDNSSAAYWFNNQLMESLPQDVYSIVEARGALNDISFEEYARQIGLGEEYKYIVEQIAGDFGADASKLSVKWTAVEEEEWTSGNKDYKFEKTYYDLINDHIASKIADSIRLNTVVSKIDYSTDTIVVTDSEGGLYEADKVIVTVPITILQDADIEFVPPLPKEKEEAFNKIGMDAGMKVFLKFNTKFYHENIIGGKICAAYADDSIGKKGTDNVLLAFVMGEQAEYLSSLENDAAITNLLLKELDEMYSGQASGSFVSSHVQDWAKNPFIKGAYSYSKVGIGNARSVAAKPIENKLFFAGEAMNLNGHHQTVQGAMETGQQQVFNIFK